MDCPSCKTPMARGSVRVDEHWVPLLLSLRGPPSQGLVFKACGKDVRLLLPCEEREAFCCPACGTLVIDGAGIGSFAEGGDIGAARVAGATVCLKCRAVIPGGETSCSKCGWTCEVEGGPEA